MEHIVTSHYENSALQYYQSGKFHKCLEFTKLAGNNVSPDLLSCAIRSAYRLQQFHLVWDYFIRFSLQDREKIDTPLLTMIADSAIQLEKFSDAVKVLDFIKNREKVPNLPTFETALCERVGTEKEILTLIDTMKQLKRNPGLKKVSDLGPWINYSFALISQGKYNEALETLVDIRKQFTGE